MGSSVFQEFCIFLSYFFSKVCNHYTSQMIKMNGSLRFVESLTFLRNFANWWIWITPSLKLTASLQLKVGRNARIVLLSYHFLLRGLAWPCMSHPQGGHDQIYLINMIEVQYGSFEEDYWIQYLCIWIVNCIGSFEIGSKNKKTQKRPMISLLFFRVFLFFWKFKMPMGQKGNWHCKLGAVHPQGEKKHIADSDLIKTTTHPHDLVKCYKTIQQPRFTGCFLVRTTWKTNVGPRWSSFSKHFAHWKLAKTNPIGSMCFFCIFTFMSGWFCMVFHVGQIYAVCFIGIPSPGAKQPRCLEKAQGDAGSLQELDIMPRFRS